jgi:hypothetical protein
MIVHRARLERRQGFLFRIVDVAMELFAMTAVLARAHAMRVAGQGSAANAIELADVFCRSSQRIVAERFRALWQNDDVRKAALGRHVLEGDDVWLERGVVGISRAPEELSPEPPLQVPPPSSSVEDVASAPR